MQILVFIVGLIAIYFIGTQWIEKRHFRSLREREASSLDFPVISLKEVKEMQITSMELVTGSTVVSIDLFKKFVAGIVNLFGGRVTTYESLLDRARRESLLRMIQQAKDKGATALLDVRIETSSINKTSKSIGTIEVLAYGTAVVWHDKDGVWI